MSQDMSPVLQECREEESERKGAGSPLSTMSSWPSRSPAGMCTWAKGQRPSGADSGLRWERLRIDNRKDRTHVLAVQQKQPLRGQEGETEKAREEHVIYVPFWFSMVSSLKPTPIQWPPGFSQSLGALHRQVKPTGGLPLTPWWHEGNDWCPVSPRLQTTTPHLCAGHPQLHFPTWLLPGSTLPCPVQCPRLSDCPSSVP